ncbi:PAS modulated sigma54 specific transcriptional regulator, Fis family [Candidatus Vecturithrix granuli]|uniref:PAS modulated sigma54 specific transcriptional regulator, Fis family n=1 Tax=Vecturithrix granuli TaxID=1499967 RepID=A0A081BU92_VECG1|nr:PAS modulated sigma54 specific transcriptional regulator, Fis family [Candidatus Vecturithrix granuli]
MDKIAEFQRKAQGNVNVIAEMIEEMSNQEISHLIHELWVHQIQLESQNDELHKQQRQLETSRSHFHDLYMYAPIGCCMFDKEGLIREANETIAAQLGIEREHLLNARFAGFLVEEDQEIFFRHLKAAFTTKCRQMDFVRLTGKRHQPLDVRLDSIPGINADEYGEQCWTAIIDISERKQLEKLIKERTIKLAQTTRQLEQAAAECKHMDEALRISEQQYRLLAEHVSDGIAMLRNGEVLFANKTFLALFGYADAPIFPIALSMLMREDARKRFEDTLIEIDKGLLKPRFEMSSMTRDGRDIWLQGAHRPIEWQGMAAILLTMRDITDTKRLELTLEQEKKRLQKEIITLKSSLKDRYKVGEIIGKSAVMQAMYEQIFKAATSDASVFIYGESGTGKELIARTIHKMSKRREQRFIPVNCGAIPETLFESEFFGHRKGSFTGAFRDKQGFFSAAHKGTLFLDELGELTPAMQVKLLRVLDDGEYMPVGETTLKKVDVRIITATNRNLDELRKRGLIREDFFFRIHVFTITIPPLRDRKDDIPLLVDHFLHRYRADDEPLPTIPAYIMEMFYTYDWPGNVREFQNAIQRYLSGQPLNFLETTQEESLKANALSPSKGSQDHREFQAVMDEFEKKLILNVLEQQRWNKSKTAAVLGIPRRTLYRKMERYGIV